MSINPTLKQTLWKRWKRGSGVLWRTILIVQVGACVVFLPAGLVGAVLVGVVAPRELVSVLGFVTGLCMLVFVVPLGLSYLRLDSESVREQQAWEIEPRIDALAKQLCVRWDDSYLGLVENLMEDGTILEARRLLRENSGMGWDEVDQGLANWTVCRMQQKIEIILKTRRSESGRISDAGKPA